MELTTVATARTTAGTDALLAVAAAAGILTLRQTTPASPQRGVWLFALGAFGLAAGLGSVVHGFAMSKTLAHVLWQPLYLLLGIVPALFVVGAVAAWRGYPAARRLLPFMLALAGVFYLATLLAAGDFRAFVIFEMSALLFAIGVYLRLAVRRREGAGWMALGLGISLAAGLVQPAKSLLVRFIWTFDHNGIFHLIQLLGLVILIRGLRVTLQSPAESFSYRKEPRCPSAP
jgi:hypothetical protein